MQGCAWVSKWGWGSGECCRGEHTGRGQCGRGLGEHVTTTINVPHSFPRACWLQACTAACFLLACIACNPTNVPLCVPPAHLQSGTVPYSRKSLHNW